MENRLTWLLAGLMAGAVQAGPKDLVRLEPVRLPSPQALCESLFKIIGWQDLRESAGPTNADRVNGSGLVRLLGKQIVETQGLDKEDPRYALFFPPEPGVPHAIFPGEPVGNVAAASTLDASPAAKQEQANRLADLLQDGRHRWRETRYFYRPFDPLAVTELASMWQRHARNAVHLQSEGEHLFRGDDVLASVQNAVEKGLHGDKPFWAHLGFQATVQGDTPSGDLIFPDAGAGYDKSVKKGEPVQVDYILTFDPTSAHRPSGMVVVLRFPQATP